MSLPLEAEETRDQFKNIANAVSKFTEHHKLRTTEPQTTTGKYMYNIPGSEETSRIVATSVIHPHPTTQHRET